MIDMWLFDLFKRKRIKKHRYKIAYSKRSRHATATFERRKNKTRGIKITHKKRGNETIQLKDNPNPDDSRPAYISTNLDKGKRSSFVFNYEKYKKYKLSKENKEIMDKMLAEKKQRKKDAKINKFKKLLKKLFKK